MARRRQVKTVAEVLNLIGEERAMEIAGVRWSSALRNWISREKRFPPDTYVAFVGILNRQGYTAPPSLWGMKSAA